MTIGRRARAALKGDFVPTRSRRTLSVAQSVRIARELDELNQNELGERTGIAISKWVLKSLESLEYRPLDLPRKCGHCLILRAGHDDAARRRP